MEIHLYFHKWKQFLWITFIWWYWRLKVGVKCIFGGLARLLSCFLLYWPVRIQFCSLEFVVCYLFLWIFLLHSWVIHGWLSLGKSLYLRDAFLVYQLYVCWICLQVVSRCFYRIAGGKHKHHIFNIWLETLKVYFLPHENIPTLGFKITG